MSVEFDPYHEWLGIPLNEQPPNHYRLLGITAFEEKATVIQNAADRLMAHLRTFQSGKHSAESQRLLNEVTKAQICLLKPEKKDAYDRLLREQLGSRDVGEESSGAKPLDQELLAVLQSQKPKKAGGAAVLPMAKALVATAQMPARKRSGPIRHKGPSIIGIILSGVAAVLLVLGINVILHQKPESNPPPIAKLPSTKPTNDSRPPVKPIPNTSPTGEPPRPVPSTPNPKPTSVPLIPPPKPNDEALLTPVWERSPNDVATGDFRFQTVPSPQVSAAAQALFIVVDGRLDLNGGRQEVNDQTLPSNSDDPSHNLFFDQGTSGGRLLVDLQRAIQIKQINTYSWHFSSRGPQVYKLYASDGSSAEFNSSPKAPIDPADAGWKLLASVDTRPKDGEPGGQYGVSLSAPAGDIGTYRYLLFDMAKTESDDPFGNTFYSRIDVLDAAARQARLNLPAAVKIKPPSDDEQKQIIAEIDQIYKTKEIRDRVLKAAIAQKLLNVGRQIPKQAERFVMFRRAAEIASDAGEADLAMKAVDTVIAEYEVRAEVVKSRILKRLLDAVPMTDTMRVMSVCDKCIDFADQAVTESATDDASSVLEAATRSLAKPLLLAQSAAGAANLAVKRARTPADAAERRETAAVAQAELETIKSKQSALADCRKSIEVVRRDRDAFAKAEAQLKTAPDDPAACLAAGRWYCFDQGDWNTGLRLLAKGSDASLKQLAAKELGPQPATTEERVARGDAWWNLAEKVGGLPRLAMRSHAGHWYQNVLPDLPSGVGRTHVERRLVAISAQPAIHGQQAISPPPAVAPFDEKTAQAHQARWAKYLQVPVLQTNSIGMRLVLIPPGEFTMGSNESDNAKPAHRVKITKPLYLGATHVTRGQFAKFVEAMNYKTEVERDGQGGSGWSHNQAPAYNWRNLGPDFQQTDEHPVVNVSWNDAVAYCDWLSRREGKKYRLPTEAQWEYACRAGTTTKWCFGNDESRLRDYAWYANGHTQAVAQGKTNAFGIYDMYGNVWQLCADRYSGDYYAVSPVEDPTGPESGDSCVPRGGAWDGGADAASSTARFGCARRGGGVSKGFRIALIPWEPSRQSALKRNAPLLAPRPAVAPSDEHYGYSENLSDRDGFRVLGTPPGAASLQSMAQFDPGCWKDDKQLWWTQARPGDKLVLAFAVRHAANYEVLVGLTKAPDYGIVRIALDGRPAGGTIDLYNSSVAPSGPISLEKLHLAEGIHRISVEIVGANPGANKAFMFGIDRIDLKGTND